MSGDAPRDGVNWIGVCSSFAGPAARIMEYLDSGQITEEVAVERLRKLAQLAIKENRTGRKEERGGQSDQASQVIDAQAAQARPLLSALLANLMSDGLLDTTPLDGLASSVERSNQRCAAGEITPEEALVEIDSHCMHFNVIDGSDITDGGGDE